MERTRRALVQALVELMLEKRYESITIQNLLDQASVGRSTFYEHYRGKDHLLVHSFERMLDLFMEMVEDSEDNRIVPVRELFQHMRDSGPFARALGRANLPDRLIRAGTVHLARRLVARLSARPATKQAVVPLAALAHVYAGALFALLIWWIEQGYPHSAAEMDAMFHTIVRRVSGT